MRFRVTIGFFLWSSIAVPGMAQHRVESEALQTEGWARPAQTPIRCENDAGKMLFAYPTEVLTRFREDIHNDEFHTFSTEQIYSFDEENPLVNYFSQEHGLALQGYKVQPYGKEPSVTYLFEGDEHLTLNAIRETSGELTIGLQHGEDLLGQNQVPRCLFLDYAPPDSFETSNTPIVNLEKSPDERSFVATTPVGEFLIGTEELLWKKFAISVFDKGMESQKEGDAWYYRQKGYLKTYLVSGPRFSLAPDLKDPDQTRLSYYQGLALNSNFNLGVGASSDLAAQNMNAFLGGNIDF